MALAEPELIDVLRGQKWTSHNVRLADGITTMPGKPDFFETDQRLQAIMRSLTVLFGGRLPGLTAADLGCLEGGFTLALARQGVEVVGIEARAGNLQKARLLQRHFDLPHLRFTLGDVKDFTRASHGSFDLVLALGILYHLDAPVAWLRQVADATDGVLFLDTHLAPSDDVGMARLDPRLALGDLEQQDEGADRYEGRWFHEFDEGVDPEPQEWASYSNHRSFWLTKASLLKALHRCGFDVLWEQHDSAVEDHAHFATTFSRTMIVAVKTPYFSAGDGGDEARASARA